MGILFSCFSRRSKSNLKFVVGALAPKFVVGALAPKFVVGAFLRAFVVGAKAAKASTTNRID